uniref:Thymosin beta 1 n=1 Tax=Takifugu rubripes TaxID=31033 RepID=A0A3B5KMF6_TAKRU
MAVLERRKQILPIKLSRMSDNPVKEEVEKFNRRSLKKTDTLVKQHVPTKEELEQEKKAEKSEQS